MRPPIHQIHFARAPSHLVHHRVAPNLFVLGMRLGWLAIRAISFDHKIQRLGRRGILNLQPPT